MRFSGAAQCICHYPGCTSPQRAAEVSCLRVCIDNVAEGRHACWAHVAPDDEWELKPWLTGVWLQICIFNLCYNTVFSEMFLLSFNSLKKNDERLKIVVTFIPVIHFLFCLIHMTEPKWSWTFGFLIYQPYHEYNITFSSVAFAYI